MLENQTGPVEGKQSKYIVNKHIEAETKMAAISQTTLSNTFSWMKMLEFR